MAYTADVNRWRGPDRRASTARIMHVHPGMVIATILGFLFWWPVGLAFLFFTLRSTKMGCWSHQDRWQNKMERMQYKMERMRDRMERRGFRFGGFGPPSSGNRAFDEYRMETLQRLEEEQTEFRDFLDRLRHAKDKEEFDQFMAQHRTAPDPALGRPAAGLSPEPGSRLSLRRDAPTRPDGDTAARLPTQAGGLFWDAGRPADRKRGISCRTRISRSQNPLW